MRMEMRYKLILAFLVVVAVVVFVPYLFDLFGVNEGAWKEFGAASAAIAVGLSLGSLFATGITRDIREMRDVANSISEGDLTLDLTPARRNFEDEFTDLRESFRVMVQRLSILARSLKGSSEDVHDSAQTLSATAEEMNASTEEIAAAIDGISKGAETQASQVERMSGTVHHMAQNLVAVAEKARTSSKVSSEAGFTAEAGRKHAENIIAKIGQVFDSVSRTGDSVMSFGERSKEIGEIVSIITNVAQQTTLLALNATIEAARAGEAGRGFAVVAEEIRKLAANTEQFAERISGIVGRIQNESEQVLLNMKDVTGVLDEGQDTLQTMGESLDEIVKAVMESTSHAQEISQLTEAQSAAASDITGIIDEVSKVAEDNAASTEEVSAATEEQTASMEELAASAQDLTALSDKLRKLSEEFKV
ncbi:MAG: methyl-accepting chemotaxis protein [bacterium]|nr:methyl-accepting chemotaxis protein [bacterium]MDT8396015.1 methyl-accepting chemotaxis protein [bacterium]